MAPKTKAAKPPQGSEDPLDDIGVAIGSVAQAIDRIDGLDKLYHLETLADNVGGLEGPLHSLAEAVAMSVIARYGDDDDRAKAVAHLKRWFDDFRDSN